MTMKTKRYTNKQIEKFAREEFNRQSRNGAFDADYNSIYNAILKKLNTNKE